MSADAAIFLNEHSGTAPSVGDLRTALGEAGFSADVLTIPKGNGVAEFVEGLAGRYGTLIAAGGDGTVSTVAAAAVRHKRTFGVIASGTLNHFAKDAGIPLDLPAALQCLRAGHTRAMDVGTVNDYIFINNASIGAYPRMVWERSRARRQGLPRPLALTLAALRTWIDLRSLTVRMKVDGEELIRRTPFIFIGNSEYDLDGLDMGHRPTMTDGRLAMYVAPDSGRLDVLIMPLHALAGKLDEHEKFESWRAASISIEPARRSVIVALDGELKTLSAPLQFGVEPKSLLTIVPE